MTLRLQWHRLKITPVVTSYPERNEKKAQLVITLFLFHSLCFNNSAFFFFHMNLSVLHWNVLMGNHRT